MIKSREWILSYLRQYLNGKKEWGTDCSWRDVLGEMKRHAMVSFLEPLWEEEAIEEEIRRQIREEASVAARQNYRLLFLTKYLVGILQAQGISVVVLKGVATAAYYPLPEMRKSGDVDLLVCDKTQWEKAEQILEQHQFVRTKEQHSLHHVVMKYRGEDAVLRGIDVELHGMLSEPLDDKKVNQFIEAEMTKIRESTEVVECMGVPLPTLSDGHHAFYLLLHMYQHFSRAGFGVKLLCDWVVFWNREIAPDEKQCYVRCIEQSGMQRFSDLITSVCVTQLGLEQSSVKAVQRDSFSEEEQALFWKEVWGAEEFGGGDSHRMVLLRGTGISALTREFHHQTTLNFPRGSKWVITWPVLWMITLVRFMKNNRKIRGQSSMAVINTARKRGKLMKKLKLFPEKRG